MSLRILAMVFAIACVLAPTAPSHAQSAAVEDTDARTLFQLGQSAFDAGRYQAALDYFQQAYDLSQRPQLLYNIGQAADRLRQDRRALAAFEAFLREAPESPQHASTRVRVDVLRAAVAEADAREARVAAITAPTPTETAAAATPSTESVPAPRESDSGGSTVGWVIAGAGGGALAVGAVFLALGFSDKSAVENAADGSTFASVRDEYDRASTRITVGTVLLGVGAAAAATGIVLAVRGGSDDDGDAIAGRLELRVAPTAFTLRRTF